VNKSVVARCGAAFVLMVVSMALAACSHPSADSDSATFDPDGTAHITRVVPMPTTISPESQKWLESLTQQKYKTQTLAERRAATDQWRAKGSAEAMKLFPVKVEEQTIGGVRTDVITPLNTPEKNKECVLINLHGGGFNSDSGSLIEGIPIANLAKIKVVSVYYRLSPENPFPAALDDVVSVYKELLKDYKPQSIGLFGTSAGANLSIEVAARLKELGLPMPAALGLFSVLADHSRPGDSLNIYALNGFPGVLSPMPPDKPISLEYAPSTDPRDPILSPIFSDLHGMPPSLLVTSTRDILLSNTTILHRALLHAGNDTQLVVFEALPHAFWYHFQLPETREALDIMASFFDQKLSHKTAAAPVKKAASHKQKHAKHGHSHHN
jgi:epsilon-lactone hydrolase